MTSWKIKDIGFSQIVFFFLVAKYHKYGEYTQGCKRYESCLWF